MNITNGKISFDAAEIEALQDRLASYRDAQGLSWSQLSAVTGVATSTVQAWTSKKYGGDNEEIARKVFRFFEGLDAKAEMLSVMPTAPNFLKTPTAQRILALLRYAQMGEIVAIAGAPGIGKTEACDYHKATFPNCYRATMKPSTRGVQTMMLELLRAMGVKDAKGSPQQLSAMVVARIEKSDGLIIFDEAQHLSEQALEEIRAWHDATGIGVALVGNDSVITRLEGGIRAAAFAQLYSRVSMRIMPKGVMDGDAEALIAAWGITEKALVDFCLKVAKQPGALRGMTKTIKAAWLAANGEQKPLSIAHLREAWAQLSLRSAA